MSTDDVAAILAAIEEQAKLSRELLNALQGLHDADAETRDAVVDLDGRLAAVTRRARLLFSMKAATLTTDCLRCGSTFASEPGPELCGPCWTELGRPERYLAPVPPIGA